VFVVGASGYEESDSSSLSLLMVALVFAPVARLSQHLLFFSSQDSSCLQEKDDVAILIEVPSSL